MDRDDFGKDSWERRWSTALSGDPHGIDQRPPNAHLVAAVSELGAGTALDAGAGHGSETLWLAARGWHVTAVDFSQIALEHARERADRAGTDVAARIDWLQADLGAWAPEPQRYDLVACLFVHVAGAVDEFISRLASGVAPGGTLLMAGHRPAPGQTQITVTEAVDALHTPCWDVVVAEERPRPATGSGVDAVVRATRH